ncbi:hypothetical protein [Fimbriiglobus ruber]|uniref:Uncharacterized protein n=1 Tax=Fimbriiglobus ruber TaxID=1908690 RepID=A0A225EBI6_9BACT|nr:hypothetical protein [Fimbriiglobus ruber]OWK45737.1 hypothetical protein FRUB_02068 [Fimbriiglobus ruber]
MSEAEKLTAIHFPSVPDLIAVVADLSAVAQSVSAEKLAQLIADVRQAISDAQN